MGCGLVLLNNVAQVAESLGQNRALVVIRLVIRLIIENARIMHVLENVRGKNVLSDSTLFLISTLFFCFFTGGLPQSHSMAWCSLFARFVLHDSYGIVNFLTHRGRARQPRTLRDDYVYYELPRADGLGLGFRLSFCSGGPHRVPDCCHRWCATRAHTHTHTHTRSIYYLSTPVF